VSHDANGLPVVFAFPPIDEVLNAFAGVLGADFKAYRNHVCRVLNYFCALSSDTNVPSAVLVAAAFHDLGIWTARTFDYLEPSIREASTYLAEQSLEHLRSEVVVIIDQHHKLRPYHGEFAANVEAYRRADLVDLSFGAYRTGIAAPFIRAVEAAYPDAGFHRRLATLAWQQFRHSPLRPLPMLRW
jgi:hypothetical protein